MRLLTDGVTIVDEPKRRIRVQIIAGGREHWGSAAGVELRGSSSMSFAKKAYSLETWDAAGDDIDVSWLGFPAEEDFVLYGPFSDKTLLRNVLAYDLVRRMGRYAPRSRFCALTVDADFRGVYVLVEKVKRDVSRVAVQKNTVHTDDPSGGWLLKIDKATGETSKVYSFDTGRTEILYEYPKADDISEAQAGYIRAYVRDFEEALLNGRDYSQLIDVASFVDYLLITELTRNVDGYRLSTFLHKERGGKLSMGPYWDNNLGFGNANYCRGADHSGWQYLFNDVCSRDAHPNFVPFWWSMLMQDDDFVLHVAARWAALRGTVFNTSSLHVQIDAYVALLGGAIAANFDRWPALLGNYVWPNPVWPANYSGEIAQLKEWIDSRVSWLDVAISNLTNATQMPPPSIGPARD